MAGSIPANIKNVSIPLFNNETVEFELSEKLTSGIIQEISSQNIVKITIDINSDSIINGVIISVSDGPDSCNNNEQVSEYRFSLSVKVSWVDNSNDTALFDKTFSAFGTYSIDNDPSSDGLDNDNDGIIDGQQNAISILLTEVNENGFVDINLGDNKSVVLVPRGLGEQNLVNGIVSSINEKGYVEINLGVNNSFVLVPYSGE